MRRSLTYFFSKGKFFSFERHDRIMKWPDTKNKRFQVIKDAQIGLITTNVTYLRINSVMQIMFRCFVDVTFK